MNWKMVQRSKVMALSWPFRTKIAAPQSSSIWSQLGRLERPLGGRILFWIVSVLLYFWETRDLLSMFNQQHCLQQAEMIPMISNKVLGWCLRDYLQLRKDPATKRLMGAISWATSVQQVSQVQSHWQFHRCTCHSLNRPSHASSSCSHPSLFWSLGAFRFLE